MAKKEFSWDKESEVKVIKMSEFEKREIKICELNGKKFVSIATLKNIKKDGVATWTYTSNFTIPKEHWATACELVSSLSMEDAFAGSCVTIVDKAEEAPKAKKTRAKKTETETTKKRGAK